MGVELLEGLCPCVVALGADTIHDSVEAHMRRTTSSLKDTRIFWVSTGIPVDLEVHNTHTALLSAVRRARAVNSVHQMRRLARERGLDEMSEEDIQAEINAARRERSR